ncbi:hypothetical protein Peur_042167 [Populus x canadensis]
MEDRDIVCKNSMVLGLIQGYVKAGDIEEAFPHNALELDVYEFFRNKVSRPNWNFILGIMLACTQCCFLVVLTACNIGGIVNEGGGFKQMTDDHGIQSVEKLYAVAGRSDHVAKLRAMIWENQIRKHRSSSRFELGSVIHEAS